MPREPDADRDAPRAVVIGAGFGGIAAALRARSLGYDVHLLERRPTLGGRARVFQQDGFTFDAGPTVITAPPLFEELFALFGERMSDHVELLPVHPWYRILFGDRRHFDYGGTPDEVRAAVIAFAPGEADGYDRFMRRSEALFDVGYTKYGAQPFDTFRSMAAALPDLVRLGGFQSVAALVAGFIRDESLRRVFSLQPLLLGGHPYRTSGIYALIPFLEQRWGVWFPRGGTGALVRALEDLMVRAGVTIRAGCTVSHIRMADGRVVGVDLDDGTVVSADIVIANADAPQVHAVLQPRSAPQRGNVDRMNYSMGLFVLCFGADRTWPDVAHHTIILGERWKALLDEIFDGDRVPDDPSLYLHRPAATDDSLQPPGQDGFYVLAPVPNLRSGIDWDVAGPLLEKRIIEILDDRVLPGLSGHIVTRLTMTPRDFEHDYLSRHGAGFSIAPTLLQSAWFRFHNRSSVPGLYLVGAGTHPGAGVPGVLTSAKVVETLLRTEPVG